MNVQFESYAINYLGGQSTTNKRGAYIYCFSGTTLVGRLQFFMNAADVAKNDYTGNIVTLSFHISQFQDVLHVLEYEKPLYLFFNSGDGRIGTWDQEPVGEQEGV